MAGPVVDTLMMLAETAAEEEAAEAAGLAMVAMGAMEVGLADPAEKVVAVRMEEVRPLGPM